MKSYSKKTASGSSALPPFPAPKLRAGQRPGCGLDRGLRCPWEGHVGFPPAALLDGLPRLQGRVFSILPALGSQGCLSAPPRCRATTVG